MTNLICLGFLLLVLESTASNDNGKIKLDSYLLILI